MTFDVSDAILIFLILLLQNPLFHIIVIIDAILIFLFWFWHWYTGRPYDHSWADWYRVGGYDDRMFLFIIMFLDLFIYIISYTYINGVWRW